MVLITTQHHLESQPADLLAQAPEQDWFLLRVLQREEQRALCRLRQLGDCDYLLLWQTTTRRYSRQRQRSTTQPFLPGNIFVRSNRYTRADLFEALRPVCDITEIIDGKTFIRELQDFCSLFLRVDSGLQSLSGYAQGDMVEVIAGPLQGCRGRVMRRADDWQLVVGLQALGTLVATHIDIDCIAHLENT